MFPPHTLQECSDTILTVKKHRSNTLIFESCHFVTSLSFFENLMGKIKKLHYFIFNLSIIT